MTNGKIITAAVLMIGDELLSGRIKDQNLGFIADYLTAIGIDLKEARVVSDEESEIVSAVNALRSRFNYVFTTGGIGPTHDDITADSMARAFGVEINHHLEAVARLEAFFQRRGIEKNEARMRMARIPVGASLIDNPVSIAPGFRLENVFVMAGVPHIMRAMMESLTPELEHGVVMQSRTFSVYAGEGVLATPLRDIQDRFDNVVIGSYPFEENGRFGSNIVLRSRDEAALETAFLAVQEMAQDLQ